MRIAILPLALVALAAPASAQQVDAQQVRKGVSSITSSDAIAKVAKLAADALEGRNAGYPGCWKAGDWIAERFAKLELKPIGEEGTYFQTFTFNARGRAAPEASGKRSSRRAKNSSKPHHETPTTRNVVALLEGTDPALRDEVIVVGGHYDHVGREGQWNKMSRRGSTKGRDDIWNGADDNASGTATVLEVAEAFAASGIRTRRSILFICFSAEEHGLYGSKWYCDHPLRPLEQTVAMLNLDMVGYARNKRVEISGVDHAEGGALREAISRALKRVRSLRFDFEPWTSSGSSDHAPFIAKGVPAVFFFTGLHKDYHTVEDEVRGLSGRRMAEIAKVVFLSVLELDALDQKPAFVPAPHLASGPALLGVRVAGTLGAKRARELGLGRKQGGLEVGGVTVRSVAAEAGLQAGDVILAIDREVLRFGREQAALKKALRKIKPGRSFRIALLRDGKRRTLKARMPQESSKR